MFPLHEADTQDPFHYIVSICCGLDHLNMLQPRQPIGPNGKLLYA